MNSRPAILLLVVLFCAAGAWLLLGGDDEPLAPDTGAPAPTTPAADRPNVADASASGDTTTTATSATDPAAAPPPQRDTVEIHEPLTPLPDDADWVEVRIVAKGSRKPVPDAVVFWFDKATREAVKQQALLESPEDVGIDREPEQYGRRFGWHTTADHRGIARVHRTERTEIVARHDHLFGHRRLSSGLVAPQNGFELEVTEDRQIRVQVLTADGKPAIGIPVAVAVRQPKSRFDSLLRWQPLAATRAPDGMATLSHIQDWGDSLDRYDSFELKVRAFVPSLNEGGVPLDLENLPSEPLIVRLPPCGTVAISIKHTPGSTPPDKVLLRENTHTGLRSPKPFLSRQVGPDGRAVFKHIPIGKSYTAQGRLDGGWITGQFSGPVNQGSHVDFELAPSNDSIRLTGRLLGTDRQPLADTKFRLTVRGKRYDNVKNTTDSNGRFVVVLGKARKENRADTIALHVDLEGQRPLIANAAPRELRVGVEDLGDLVLGLDALIVAGVCTIDGKPGNLPRSVSLQYGEPREGGEMRWRTIRQPKRFIGENGTFEYRGTTEHEVLRLRVFSNQHFPIEPVEFRRGSKGLAIALEAGEALAATMLYSRGDAQLPIVELIDQSDASAKPREGQVVARTDERCQADWPGLSPGTYSLNVRVPGIAKPVIRIDDIAVPPPADGDPRLVDIDLASLVMHQVLRVTDHEGKALSNPRGGAFPNGQSPEDKLIGAGLSRKGATVLLPRGAADVLIAVRGYRPVTVQCTGQPLDIRIHPWGTATVTLPELTPLPSGLNLELRTAPANKSKRFWKADWRSGTIGQLLGPYAYGAKFSNGRAEVPVAEDQQPLKLLLRRGRRTWPVEIPEQAVSEVTGSMTLRVSQEAVDKALAASQPKK